MEICVFRNVGVHDWLEKMTDVIKRRAKTKGAQKPSLGRHAHATQMSRHSARNKKNLWKTRSFQPNRAKSFSVRPIMLAEHGKHFSGNQNVCET
jgi:hypothetical protein